MNIPREYHGREQSYLKHQVLTEYLRLWGHKLGSLARKGPVRLWYVDCFAGPWQQRDQDLRDTSIYIGLKSLEEAGETWRKQGHTIELGAIFVEKKKRAFEQLDVYLRARAGAVKTIPLRGEFGACVPDIRKHLGDDPAFVFVDPTGFKGVEMQHIKPLMQPRMRDVLVNVMFNHINRFKDDPREFLRKQMCAFFGLGDETLPPGLSEPELLKLYRQKLKDNCGIQYAADLAVPHPTRERTWFRLVIGGKHPKVLQVFRDVENQVMGERAARIRMGAKQRYQEDRSNQLSFGLHGDLPQGHWYERQNLDDRQVILQELMTRLPSTGSRPFALLWPALLEEHHLTYSELARLVADAARTNLLRIAPDRPRRRATQDDDEISLLPGVMQPRG